MDVYFKRSKIHVNMSYIQSVDFNSCYYLILNLNPKNTY